MLYITLLAISFILHRTYFYLSHYRKLFFLLATPVILLPRQRTSEVCRNNCNVNGHAVFGQCIPVCNKVQLLVTADNMRNSGNVIQCVEEYARERTPVLRAEEFAILEERMGWLRVTPLQIQPVASLLSSGGRLRVQHSHRKITAEEKHGCSLGIRRGKSFRRQQSQLQLQSQ